VDTERESWLKIARTYINTNKSFRLFEQESGVPATLSSGVWSQAAQQLNNGEYPRRSHRVVWVIDVDASCPEGAALAAQEIMQDLKSTATVFDVQELNSNKEAVMVDLGRAS
jgi:hypothetical protein